jgi:phage-related protein
VALGGSGRKIVVEFIGDASALKAGVRDGEAALQGFGSKAKAVGNIAGKVLAGGLLLGGVAAVKAGQAAAADEAAQAQLAQQLRQAAGASDAQIASTEAWITAQGKATGIADDELRPAIAKLATATGDVTKAQQLAAEAMDIAAGSGQSLETVTKTLARAQVTGSVAAYAKLGGATKDAAGNTLDLATATQQLADKYKGAAAKAAETTAGKQKILSTQFGELQEQIGANLLPAMVKLADIGLKVTNWVANNTTTVGVAIGAIAALTAVTWGVGAAISAWTAITKIATAIQIVWTNAQWALNIALSANPIGLVVVAIAALVAGIIIAYKNSETFRNIVGKLFDAMKKGWDLVLKGFKIAWDFITSHWRLIITILGGPMGLAVALITKHWDKIKAGGLIVFNWVKDKWPLIKAILTGPLENAKTAIGAVWTAIRKGASFVKDVVTGAFRAITSAIQSAIDRAQTLLEKLHLISQQKGSAVKGNDGSKQAAEGEKLGAMTMDGYKKGLTKGAKKAIAALNEQLQAVRDQFSSLKESVTSSFSDGLFDADNAKDFLSGLLTKSGQLSQLKAAFKTLSGWGWKPAALSALFQSGNAGLILDLAANKDMATSGAGLYESVTGAASDLGFGVAQNQYGGEIQSLVNQIDAIKGGPAYQNRTYNVNVNVPVNGDPVATGREVVKVIRSLERNTGRQLLVSRG